MSNLGGALQVRGPRAPEFSQYRMGPNTHAVISNMALGGGANGAAASGLSS